jgi:hypothetical protein
MDAILATILRVDEQFVATHASDWGDSLNPRHRGGTWLTSVVIFVVEFH